MPTSTGSRPRTWSASGVEAVVNVAQSSTDRYPEPRPADPRPRRRRAASTCRRRRCSRSSPTATRSSIQGGEVRSNGGVLATGRVIDLATATEQIERQRERINEALADFAANTIEHVERRGRAAGRQDRLPPRADRLPRPPRADRRPRHHLPARPAHPARLHRGHPPGAGRRRRRRRRDPRGGLRARHDPRRHGLGHRRGAHLRRRGRRPRLRRRPRARPRAARGARPRAR